MTQQPNGINGFAHNTLKDWRFWLVVAGFASSVGIAQYRLNAMASDQIETQEEVESNKEGIESIEKDLIVIQKDGEARDKEIETLQKGQGVILQKIERSGDRTSQAFKDLLDELRKSQE